MARKRRNLATPPAPTEADWLGCQDACKLLEMVKERVSLRKIRLVGVACCRRLRKLFHAEACHVGVEVAERYADGLASEEELLAAYCAVGNLKEGDYSLGSLPRLWMNRTACMSGITVYETLMPNPRIQVDGGSTIVYRAADAAFAGAYEALGTRDDAASYAGTAARTAEEVAQVQLIRDVLGNPFHPLSLDPTYRTPTVVALAQSAYDDRTLPSGTLQPDRLAVLADALEDAGCGEPAILGHLRGPGLHVRGCHVLDLLLGRS